MKEAILGAFTKRKEFDHEREVRIVRMLDSQQTLQNGPLLQFSIPANFIDEFCVDPRADGNLVSTITNQLLAAGVPANTICQSQLYHFNPNKMIFA